MNKKKIIQAIRDQGVLPLFYDDRAKVSLSVVKTLYAAGVRAVEYTNRGKYALTNFKVLKQAVMADMPDLYLGIGTIHHRQEAVDFIEAGADFIVCPTVRAEIGDLCAREKVLWVPGCFTPTEVALAQEYGAGIIKVFPASVLGASFVSAIRSVFPNQLFMPTGGVPLEEDALKAWFQAGVCAVGLGGNLVGKEVLEKLDYKALKKATHEAIDLVQRCR